MMYRASIAALLILAGCGPLANEQPIIQASRSLVGGDSDAGSIALDPRRDLTRELIENTPNDLLLVAILSRDAAATAQPIASNGTSQTWVTLDGVSFTFDNGMLIASRGLGDDLMGGDASESYQRLLAGGGPAARLGDYLDGEDQIVRRLFQCDVTARGYEEIHIFERSYDTHRFSEICRTETHEYENLYWVDAQGVIWQSRQWVSPMIGYLEYQRL